MLRPFLLASAILLSCALTPTRAEVRLTHDADGYRLLRDGKPFLIKGGGGDGKALPSLSAAGGNSVRLWGDEALGETLDAAQKLGLTVTAGIWLGQVRQGFDWTDAEGLAKQRDHIREVVEKYRHHPALLCWGLGNEMEDGEGKNGAVWTAINSLAVMVRQLDPDHPTMTVIAEIGGSKVKNIHRLCPEIDIIGINSYAGATSLPERYRKAGGTKPYILTEYGPAGIWEVKRDSLGAYPEPTSTAKAATYRSNYQAAVLGSKGLCLGSYAFLWGQKQEVTSTWFSMFLSDGSRLAPADAISELWSGKAPSNRCPEITTFALETPASGKPGTTVKVKLAASDPENDKLQAEWSLQHDPEQYGSGGDKESAPPIVSGAIVHSDLTGAELRLPAEGGLYRLFATVRDGHGGAAVGNIALRVEAPITVAPAGKATLPLTVYSEDGENPSYIPSGWMGDAKSIKLDPASTTDPHSGKTCLKCEFQGTQGWGGVVWQNPAGDWGDRGGGFDMTGAKKITFWARGDAGGEVVNFEFGVLAADKKFHDSAKGALPKVSLSKEWQRFEIPVAGSDLSRIKTAFVWTLASPGHPVAFYLDDIRWE